MQPLIYSLGALGLPRSGGLSKRPLLLGTVETERLLHALAQQATHPTQRVKRDREAGHSAFEGWLQKFIPQHLPGRDSAAARWHARANKPHPRAPYVTKLPKPKPAAKLHRPVGRPPGQPRVPPSPPSNAEPPPNKRARKTPPTSIRKRAQPKPETPKRASPALGSH